MLIETNTLTLSHTTTGTAKLISLNCAAHITMKYYVFISAKFKTIVNLASYYVNKLLAYHQYQ